MHMGISPKLVPPQVQGGPVWDYRHGLCDFFGDCGLGLGLCRALAPERDPQGRQLDRGMKSKSRQTVTHTKDSDPPSSRSPRAVARVPNTQWVWVSVGGARFPDGTSFPLNSGRPVGCAAGNPAETVPALTLFRKGRPKQMVTEKSHGPCR